MLPITRSIDERQQVKQKTSLCLACVTGKYPTPCAQKMADTAKKMFFEGREIKSRVYEVDEVQP